MNIKLDKQRWDSFWSYWEKELPGQIKDAKRQAVQAAGEAIRDEVARQVRSRVSDAHGGWSGGSSCGWAAAAISPCPR